MAPRSNFDDVGDFHERFGLDNVTHHNPGIREVDAETLRFRIKFLREELREFEEAADSGDRAKQFDALLDLTYVAMGTAHLMGFPWQDGWEEVQRANMTKQRAMPDGSDSKRQSPLDVVKPDGWTPPNINAILASQLPARCRVCHRVLADHVLKEVIVQRLGTSWVDVHCPCGVRILERPA